jgi:hypothetical protein
MTPPDPAEPSLLAELHANKQITARHVSNSCLVLARAVTVVLARAVIVTERDITERDTISNFDMARTVGSYLQKINRG